MESVQPVFTVKSVSQAITWYQTVLQFDTVFVNETNEANSANYAVLKNGNAGLHLGLAGDMENDAGQGACNFVTQDFERTYQREKEAQVEFYIKLNEVPNGARTFGIKDPDGNLMTFVEAA